MRAVHVAAVVLGTATAGVLTACGATAGQAVPAAAQSTTTSSALATTPPPKTVYVLPPSTRTVVVTPPAEAGASSEWFAQPRWIDAQPWIDITATGAQTDCQWLYASGYSYAEAFAAWAQRGYPENWSATKDGYPCQRSYGMQH